MSIIPPPVGYTFARTRNKIGEAISVLDSIEKRGWLTQSSRDNISLVIESLEDIFLEMESQNPTKKDE